MKTALNALKQLNLELKGFSRQLGGYKKLATLNPENIPINVISIDI
jgi:hypothetical protein